MVPGASGTSALPGGSASALHRRDIAAKEITVAEGVTDRWGIMTGIIWFAVAVIWLAITAYAYPS